MSLEKDFPELSAFLAVRPYTIPAALTALPPEVKMAFHGDVVTFSGSGSAIADELDGKNFVVKRDTIEEYYGSISINSGVEESEPQDSGDSELSNAETLDLPPVE